MYNPRLLQKNTRILSQLEKSMPKKIFEQVKEQKEKEIKDNYTSMEQIIQVIDMYNYNNRA